MWIKKSIKIFLVLPLLVISLQGVETSITQKDFASAKPMINNTYKAQGKWQKALKIKGVEYDLYLPPNHESNPNRPSILVLPGWNFPRTSWIQNTDLVKYADQNGYALLLPEMATTIYESKYYPQTTLKWNPTMAGGEFIKKHFILEVQKKHNLLQTGQQNMLLGLSTGGRGVALIALENPGLFVAGASLSGDFNQEATPADKLMIAVYGPYKQFKALWIGEDNPQRRVNEWVMPLYLAHGVKDNVVPVQQSQSFYQALKGANKTMVEYHQIPNAGHDYKFWGSQLPAVFKFFKSKDFFKEK